MYIAKIIAILKASRKGETSLLAHRRKISSKSTALQGNDRNGIFQTNVSFEVLFPKREQMFQRGLQNQETNESTRCLDTPMKHEARVLEITSHDHS